jgi:CRISPR-associated endonuclease Cas1
VSTLYLTEEYAIVRRDSEDCLLVQIPERRASEDKEAVPAQKRRIPLVKVENVVVQGEITMTSSALHLLLEKNIEIHFLNRYGAFKGSLAPTLSKNALLRLAQHRVHNDILQRSELAKQFILGKLSNQRLLLQRHNRRQEQRPFEQTLTQLTDIIQRLQHFSCLDAIAPVLVNGDTGIHGTAIETMLGMEGAGSALYFQCLSGMFADQQQWSFPGRVRRPPTDPVNALLSYGYTILASRVGCAVQMVGFDHYIGYLHSSAYGRPALALDLMEEFRPLIVDSVVLTLLNNRMLARTDFQEEVGTYRLKKEPRTVFLTKFEERLNEEVTHPVFGYKVKYKQCIELQARLLAKCLTGEIPRYIPFTMR